MQDSTGLRRCAKRYPCSPIPCADSLAQRWSSKTRIADSRRQNDRDCNARHRQGVAPRGADFPLAHMAKLTCALQLGLLAENQSIKSRVPPVAGLTACLGGLRRGACAGARRIGRCCDTAPAYARTDGARPAIRCAPSARSQPPVCESGKPARQAAPATALSHERELGDAWSGIKRRRSFTASVATRSICGVGQSLMSIRPASPTAHRAERHAAQDTSTPPMPARKPSKAAFVGPAPGCPGRTCPA